MPFFVVITILKVFEHYKYIYVVEELTCMCHSVILAASSGLFPKFPVKLFLTCVSVGALGKGIFNYCWNTVK